MSSLLAAYLELPVRGGVADLSDRVKLLLTGADRVRYLNGQVTSNVQKLAAGQTQPACVTTAKGRLCAEVLITALDGALFIDADAALRDTLPARLERYIIADDAVLEDVTDTRALLHFFGPRPSAHCVPARRFGRDGWDEQLLARNASRGDPPLTRREHADAGFATHDREQGGDRCRVLAERDDPKMGMCLAQPSQRASSRRIGIRRFAHGSRQCAHCTTLGVQR